MRIQHFIILFLLIGFTYQSKAWHDPTGPGASSSAMGGCGVASTNFWGFSHNQAGLAYQKNAAVGIHYENQFMLKQMSYNHMAGVLPTANGAFGLQISYFGYSEYNEQIYGLSYGRKLGDKLALGVQLDYLKTHIGGEFGNRGLLSFDIGMMYQLSEDVMLGAHVFNPLQVKLSDYNSERIPAIMSFGAEWKLNEQLRVLGEVQSDASEKLQFKTGAEYLINGWFALRLGLSTDPSIFSFGAGIYLGQLHLDFSSGMHSLLGYSPQFSMHYTFGTE